MLHHHSKVKLDFLVQNYSFYVIADLVRTDFLTDLVRIISLCPQSHVQKQLEYISSNRKGKY